MLPFSLTYRDYLMTAGVVLLAFALRVVVVFERAHNDWAFDPLPIGTDQRAYWSQAAEYQAGNWPRQPFTFQPGITYYVVGLRLFAGDSPGMARLFTSLTGAFTCGLMIGAGWLLTRRRWGGYLAGLILAVYPPAIFYATVLLDPVIATFYTALFVFLALWQDKKPVFWRSALLGVVIGLLTITRSNLAILALAWLVVLALARPDKGAILRHAAVFGVAVLLTVAPVTLWNLQSGNGRFQLVSSAGMDEVYRANNRDATGQRSGDPAMDIVPGSFADALLADIRLNPLRFITLQGRKLGLYWSGGESGNNIDYFANGLSASALLRALPFDFRWLAAAGLLGLALLFYQQGRMFVFFALVNGLILVSVMPLWIEGRLRQPAVVPLVLTAAYLGTALPALLPERGWRVLVIPAALTAMLFVVSDWAAANLPVKRPVLAVPPDARRLEVRFDGALRLVAWRTLPEWPAPAWAWGLRDTPYAVELFWQLTAPTQKDYNFYLAYVDSGVRYGGRDRAIGGISYPAKPTSAWQVGEIYSEIAGFRFNQPNLPTGRSGEVQLGVYTWDSAGQIVNVAVENGAGYVVLQRFALVDLAAPDPPPPDMRASELVFGGAPGDSLALLGYAVPEQARAGERLTLSFYWQALADVREDYNLFVHVMDADDVLAAQHDSPPRDGLFPTSTWPFVVPVRDEIELVMPETPGRYTIYIGLKHTITGERLPVPAPDNRPQIGQIVVSAP